MAMQACRISVPASTTAWTWRASRRSKNEQRVQVAVAGVKDVADRQPVIARDAVDRVHDLGQPRPRDARILDVVVGRDAADRAGRTFARRPQRVAFGLIAAARQDSAPCSRAIAASVASPAATSSCAPAISTAAPRRRSPDTRRESGLRPPA